MPILFLIVFIDLLGFGLVIPLLPFYGLHFGASTIEVTWLMGVYSFAQLFSAPLLGRLSDRFGRKPILVLGLTCSVASYLWFALADHMWMLFAARLLAGAGAGTVGAVFAYVTDVTTEQNRAKGMGIIGAAFGLGFTLGPALGGLVTGSAPTVSDLAIPSFIAAGFSAMALILTLLLLKESVPEAARAPKPRASRAEFARRIWQRPVLRRLILIAFVTTAAFAGLETTFALWAHGAFDWGPRQIGLTFFYVGALLTIVQGGLVGPLTKLFGETRLLVASACILMLGLFGIPFALGLAPLMIVIGGLGVGMALFGPSSNSLISREASIDERGGVLGVSQSAQSLARVIGPLVAGPLFAEFGRDSPYFAGSAAMAVVLLIALGLPRRAPAEAPAA
jgi:MFS transporter, DHA1 family, tetracycline resistance protein